MSPARRALDRRLAWTAAIAVPLVAAGAILMPMAASGAVDLPDKTVEELLEFAAASDVDAMSGTIEQTSELGLPDLDALVGGGDSGSETEGDASTPDVDDLLELVTGTHTANVYLDGERARLQVLDRLAERNVYADGDAEEVWYVDSETKTATRFTVAGGGGLLEQQRPGPDGADAPLPTPDQMLDDALARLDETTEVTVGTDARVAGRDVYELILTPRTADTLVGDIRFAIDGENGAALAGSITARGATEPAFHVAFTRVSFESPDPSVFAFAPGDGIAVQEEVLPLPTAEEWALWQTKAHSGARTDGVTVLGEGWSAVAELPASEDGGASTNPDAETRELLEGITTVVPDGRALETSLVSVLIADDGRILVGAVPVSRLVEAAATGR
ncbi:hypothetical protein [Microbacterium sp.]|uniref:LolA family protein n=1 Tax=Microbacterium sp. TaxID=51671 RepID=UPI002E32F796|nr:hypothetical protein [Microbacterium sp.]HEX5728003.1 hypothetical protein [Microbacterium sp.]